MSRTAKYFLNRSHVHIVITFFNESHAQRIPLDEVLEDISSALSSRPGFLSVILVGTLQKQMHLLPIQEMAGTTQKLHEAAQSQRDGLEAELMHERESRRSLCCGISVVDSWLRNLIRRKSL